MANFKKRAPGHRRAEFFHRCFRTSHSPSSTIISPRPGGQRGIHTSASNADAKASPTTALSVTRTIGWLWWPEPELTLSICARRRQRCFFQWAYSFQRRRRRSSTLTKASTSWGCTSSVISSEAPPSASCTPTHPDPPLRRLRPKYVTRRADRRTRPSPSCCTDSILCCADGRTTTVMGQPPNLLLSLRLHLAASVVLVVPQIPQDGYGSATTAPYSELVADAGRSAFVQPSNGSHHTLPVSGGDNPIAMGDHDQGHFVADWHEHVESRMRG